MEAFPSSVQTMIIIIYLEILPEQMSGLTIVGYIFKK